MKILISLGHPAHYHLFKNIAKNLEQKNNKVLHTIRHKDVLKSLITSNNFEFKELNNKNRGLNIFASLKDIIVRLCRLAVINKKFKPDIIISSSPEAAIIGKVMNVVTFLYSEDDLIQVKNWVRITAPFTTVYLCPTCCSADSWESKTIHYNGYHELAYLHPKYFSPNGNIVKRYLSIDKPYFILRFAKLTAYHDRRIRGIRTEVARKIINLLKPHGNIFITSERELEPEFEKYRLNINPIDIHHVMAYSTIHIGDSQTMAAEAAVLGVPSIRFNDFVGKLGYLEELEHKYGLTFGVNPSEPEKLFQTIKKILDMPNLENIWQKRRKKMLNEKIDVTQFMTWFIENYPESVAIMEHDPSYQYKFK